MEDFEQKEEKVITIGSKDIEQVDEETAERVSKRAERQARLLTLLKVWTYFKPIYNKIQNGMTLEEVQEEIHQKKSNLTATTRAFAMTQEKYIRLWIEDLKWLKSLDEEDEKKNKQFEKLIK